MRIQIKVFLEAEDEMDVEATNPDYSLITSGWEEAIATIGMLQRKVDKLPSIVTGYND
jgi:hypothetical protein